MALNFSHRPLFAAHLPEENLVSPMRIANGYLVEGMSEKVDDCFDYGMDRSNRCGSQESVHKDILDLLPSDPFGMDISTTFTAITGWLEDLEMGYGGYSRDQDTTRNGNYELFAGFNLIWSNAMRFQAFPGNKQFDHKANVVDGYGDGYQVQKEVGGAYTSSVVGGYGDGYLVQKEVGGAYTSSVVGGYSALGSASNMDILSMHNENGSVLDERRGQCQECSAACHVGDGGALHTVFTSVLGYLGVRELLVVEMVCKWLHSMVRNDSHFWRSIHVDQPLNEKITDDILLQLTNRAEGTLQCLSLVECPRITDDGLKRMLDNNPRLTKLSVPGCTRLSIEGIVNSLKAFKTMGSQGVKHLRIGGIYGVTQKHFEELKLLLGTDNLIQKNTSKPHFYHRGNIYLSCEDDRAIDIEMCPRCQNLRLVYDCPAEGCQGKENPSQVCRGCSICISRCIQCGRCINDSEYEETFCLEYLCSDCLKMLLKSQEKQDRMIGLPEPPVFHEFSCSVQIHG